MIDVMEGFGTGMIQAFSSSAGQGLVLLWALKGTAILAVALGLSFLLGRAAASVRHRVWAVALTVVLVLPVLELGPDLPLLPGLSLPGDEALGPAGEVPGLLWGSVQGGLGEGLGTPVADDVASGRGALVAGRSSEAAVDAVNQPGVVTRGDRSLPPEPRTVASRPAPVGADTPAGPVEATGAGPVVGRLNLAGPALLWTVWSAGVMAWLAMIAAGLRGARGRFTRAQEPPAWIAREASGVSKRLGIAKSVTVRLGATRVPVTWGWRHPRVLLPAPARSWEPARVRRILLHELAHIQRGDWLVGLVAELARAVHWYNPLVWVAVGRMRVERERACDDVVLAMGTRATDYARDLLQVARGDGGRLRPAAVMALGRAHRLADRVNDLLDPSRSRSEGRLATALSRGALTLGFLPLALVTVAAGGTAAQDDHEALPGVPPAVSTPPGAPGVGLGAPPAAAVVVSTGLAPVLQEAGRVAPRGPDGPAEPGPRDRLPTPGVVSLSELPPRVNALLPRRLQQTFPVCNWDRGSGQGRSMQVNVDDDGDWEIRWRTPECEAEIWLEGDVVFNATEDGIASMGRGARFEARERLDGVRRRLVAESADGGIEYRFWLNREEAEFDRTARQWFATFLPQLFRQTTLQAGERVARLYAAGGTEGVLEEVRQMGSDHVAARYLELLMGQSGFAPDEVPAVLDVVADRLESDHYVAGILEAVGERWGVRPPYQESYMRAVDGLESDHYAHGALVALVRDDMSGEMADRIVAASGSIESDHYKADLLTRLARADGIQTANRSAYVDAFASVESDHYQHAIVMALLDLGPPTPEELRRVLALLHTVDSDHYRADVLTRIARDTDLEGGAADAFLQAARGIESDHYASEVGRVLVNRTELSASQIGLVLDIAEGIGGDHGRAELMRALIREHGLSASQRERYRELALGIDSQHLQDQVLAELVR